MKNISLLLIMFFSMGSLSAKVIDSNLTLAHDVDKSAILRLEISGDLFRQLSNGGTSIGYQLQDNNNKSFYGDEVYWRADFTLFNSSKDTRFANLILFDGSRLDNTGVVDFFTTLKKMKIVFYEYTQNKPIQSGVLSLESLCGAGKVLNLSGADKCNISEDQVTSPALGFGVCEDNADLISIAPSACSHDALKLSLEKNYNCIFKCEQ